MSRDTRFRKGQSGNPGGRPKARRPNISAFDIILDRKLTVTQNGIEREFTIDEALQLQTYKAALGGSRMAIRKVLRMIERREVALAKKQRPDHKGVTVRHEHDADNAHKAMQILGIADYNPRGSGFVDRGEARLKLATWAVQGAISRPGKRALSEEDRANIALFTLEPDLLKWPRGARS